MTTRNFRLIEPLIEFLFLLLRRHYFECNVRFTLDLQIIVLIWPKTFIIIIIYYYI